MTTWTLASAAGMAAPGGIPADAPDWARREMQEMAQRNRAGLCWRGGCGQPVDDGSACATHRQTPATGENRSRPRPLPRARRRVRRYY